MLIPCLYYFLYHPFTSYILCISNIDGIPNFYWFERPFLLPFLILLDFLLVRFFEFLFLLALAIITNESIEKLRRKTLFASYILSAYRTFLTLDHGVDQTHLAEAMATMSYFSWHNNISTNRTHDILFLNIFLILYELEVIFFMLRNMRISNFAFF